MMGITVAVSAALRLIEVPVQKRIAKI